MPALEEQRRIAGGLALEAMAARIAYDIGFGLDDAPAHATRRMVAHEGLADQPAGEACGGSRQCGAGEGVDVHRGRCATAPAEFRGTSTPQISADRHAHATRERGRVAPRARRPTAVAEGAYECA